MADTPDKARPGPDDDEALFLEAVRVALGSGPEVQAGSLSRADFVAACESLKDLPAEPDPVSRADADAARPADPDGGKKWQLYSGQVTGEVAAGSAQFPGDQGTTFYTYLIDADAERAFAPPGTEPFRYGQAHPRAGDQVTLPDGTVCQVLWEEFDGPFLKLLLRPYFGREVSAGQVTAAVKSRRPVPPATGHGA